MGLLEYVLFQNTLIGSLLTTIVCGIVGIYIVPRRLVFTNGGIMHASFGGSGLGFYLGTDPISTAVLFSILSVFGMKWTSRTQSVRGDSVIAGVWSLGMALGMIFIFLTPGYTPNLSAYLFDSMLTISMADILWILGPMVLLILIFSLFLREIVYMAFDRDFAVAQGLPVKWTEYMMMCSIAMTVVLSVRLVGVMLLVSLLTLPQITASLLTSNFKKVTWGSVAIGLLGCVSGLTLPYFLNVSSDAFIILFLVVLFLALKAIKPLLRR